MIKKIFSNELFKGSFITLILFNLFNVFQAVFHFIGARVLGAEDYGILATLLGISFILGIPAEAIQTIISRYTTEFYVKKDYSKIKNLIKKSYKKFSLLFLVGIALFAIFSPLIGKFLLIDSKIIFLMSLFLIATFFIPVNRGVLQGEKKFIKLGISLVSESFTKVLFLIVFFFLGLRLYGAMWAIILGFIISFLISFFFIKKIFKTKEEETPFRGIYSYSWNVLIITGCMILFISMDIILAKRFFSAQDVGLYAAISILGKTIFFAVAPISKAMFPLVSEKRDKKEDSKGLIKRSLLIVSGICAIGIILFWLFPNLIISLFYGSTYLKFSNLLVYFGVAMGLLSITNIFIYNVICHKRKIGLFLIFFVILQIGLLSIFHSTVFEYILVLLISNSLTLMFFGIDYIKNTYSKYSM